MMAWRVRIRTLHAAAPDQPRPEGMAMVQQDTLSEVLSDFARTMLTDFRIQAILDHLVDRIVDILAISGAGVTLISPGSSPHYVAASGPEALHFEQLQTELGQGPCLTAYATGELVAIPDLARDERYPQFSAAAVSGGLAAVFTFPLRSGDGRLGALDLYRDTAGGLNPEDLAAAQTLADVAAAYLLNAQARELVLQASERFKASSLHDALTGLPNRILLQERLEHAASRAARSHSTAAVLFADLDRFKRVNDIYGHFVGDSLLIAVAQRLATLVRPGDTLARVSGDEFVILCEDLTDPSDGEVLADRLSEAISVPFAIEQTEIVVTASVGVAYSRPGEPITYQLVIDADAAMYDAKRAGGAAHRVVDLPAARQQREHNNLERDLWQALGGDDLDLAYQPIVRSSDGLVTGVEALLRWTHPAHGPVPAITAINIAERSGLIVEIGAWVLQRSCRDRARWLRDHPGQPLDLSVNVSALQVTGAGFVGTVADILRKSQMEPSSLVLEVTEGIFIENGERALAVLADLKALGVRLALDDFGTGYSSLNYLRRFPVDIVKIDQGFVSDIDRDPAAAAIVAAVTQLTHVLGMTVIAEGVETEEQRRKLVLLGCEQAQGYLFARPLPDLDLTDRLAHPSGPLLYLP